MRRASAAETLVGRERELAQVRAALTDAEAGKGGVLLVSGDAGIGKTRLLEAVADHPGTTEVRTVWGRCWEAGGSRAYWPIVQVVRGCADDMSPERLVRCLGSGASDVARLVPELTTHLPPRAAESPVESSQHRLRLFRSVTEFLVASAREGPPLLVAVEDLHAADDASLKLLRSLARGLTGARLLVIGTYREAELRDAPERQRLLASIGAEGRVIRLGGLDPPGVAELLERISGRVPTVDVVAEVHRLTEGNPFFVGEIARLMAAEARTGAVALPGEVHRLIRLQLEALAPPVRHVLAQAAVLGQEFELAVLRRLTDLGGGDLLDALAAAGELRVVNELALGRWSFTHSLFREVLYEELPSRDRLTLHRRAGEALEELYGQQPSPWLSQLAHHFFAASGTGGAEKAVGYCRAAAGSDLETLAYESAAAWYRCALEAADVAGTDPRDRYDLLMACAEAEWRSSGFGQAGETYRRAIRLAQALGDADREGRAALAFAQGGGPERWLPVLERALEALDGSQSALRAEVAVRLALANVLLGRGDTIHWVQAARREVEAVREEGDPDAAWRTLWSFHRILHFDGQGLDERLVVSSELVAWAERLQDGEKLFRSRSFRVGDLFERGEVGAVEQELGVLEDQARRLRVQYFDWVVAYMRAAMVLLEGRVDEAEALASRAVVVAEALESPEVDNIFACQMLEIRRQQGRFQEMRALAEGARQQFPHEFLVPLELAVALAELGAADEARRELDRSPAAREPGDLSGTKAIAAWTYLADVAWSTGDHERASALGELLRPHGGRHVTLAVAGASLGSADRSLGRLATLQGRWEQAEEYFRSAHALHERLGARAWLAHGKTDHARMLLARRGPGDDQRARDLLSEAHASFQELGLAFEARRAGLLAEIGAGSRPASIRASFRQDGDGWVLEYAGATVRLRDSKGLHHLARLLSHPGRQFSALELLDDDGSVEREQARHRVAGAVRSAIDRIADSHPALAEHLSTTVRVGTTSSYVPDARAPVTWDA